MRQQLTRTEEGSSFTKPKNGKGRSVSLRDSTVEVLRLHQEKQTEEMSILGNLWKDTGLVFTSTVGTALNPSNVTNRSFRPLLKQAELPQIRFHDLRHTFATLFLSEGVHPKIVQEMLGHATINITLDTYSHVLPNLQNKVVREIESDLL